MWFARVRGDAADGYPPLRVSVCRAMEKLALVWEAYEAG